MMIMNPSAHAASVREMFARIARHYDLLNRLMTLGQDRRWRSAAIHRLEISPSAPILDVGCGTGDIALEIARRYAEPTIVGLDFTWEMIAIARRRPGGDRVNWIVADALHLPFPRNVFQGVISGFLMRNVPDVPAALVEQRRVCQPAGRLAVLDTTRPRPGLFSPLIQFHLRVGIPLLGRLIAGDAQAYRYLPETTRLFLSAESLAEAIQRAGFDAVGFARRMLGTIAIHWARKPIK